MRLARTSALVHLFITASLAAQETTGGVRGRLVSPTAGGIGRATVTATSPHLLGERWVLSATDGVFQFILLTPGIYTLRVRAIGHRPLLIDSVVVQLGRITGLGDVALEPAAVELSEITITAPAMTLDPVRTTIGATLSAEELASLPTERDYKSAIVILPHINTSYHGDPANVGGSTGLENMYFIDGMNVTSALTAVSGTSLPYNFVRAVEVKAGGYEAQYGKALGAVVNAITYSGTNEFESQVFGFATGGALRLEPRTVPTLPETGAVSYDLGGRVSGPVVRDRLWFSAAYNPRVDQVDKEIPGVGVHTDRTMAHIFAGKLTWRPAPAANVELSLFGDPSVRHQVTPPGNLQAITADPLLRRLESGGVTGSLRTTATLGADVLLEAALAYSRGNQSTLPETDAGRTQPRLEDYVDRTMEGGVRDIREVSQGRATALLRATVMSGRHTIVGGIEYEDARVTHTFSESGGVVYFRGLSAPWETVEQYSTGAFHSRIPTAYAQDAWRLTDRLTLSAGLRWSGQFLTGASGGSAQRFPDEWQPRAGFSWELGRTSTHRLFGSYGRFYQQIPLNMSTLWYADAIFILSGYSTDPRGAGAVPDWVFDGTTYEEDWAQSIEGLSVEHFDELSLGYERLLKGHHRLTLRGVRRDLRSSFQFGLDPSLPQQWVVGTPGKGDFAFLPPPKRTYTALEVALGGALSHIEYRASYVLSRTAGNYTGLYYSDGNMDPNPGGNFAFFEPEQAVNSEGPLPNDRTHVFKLTAAYQPVPPLHIGGLFTVASGIPENAFAPDLLGGFGPIFVVPRGSVGRTPTIWDLNLRLAYDLPWQRIGRGRAVLDLLHVGNPRTAVEVDEYQYSSRDPVTSQPTNPNPTYLQPTMYQPPMAVRLGMEVSF